MTKAIFFLLFASLFIFCNVPNNFSQREKKFTASDYKDFVIDSNRICALTTTGKINIFDIEKEEILKDSTFDDSSVIVITKDRLGSIVIGDSNKKIKRFDKKNKIWRDIATYQNLLLGVVFNSQNECFVITDKGIAKVGSEKYYFLDSSLNHQINYHEEWFRQPAYVIDDSDNIWLGFGYGEWGGDIFIFNTVSKKFIIPDLNTFRITLNPVKSFFKYGKTVGLSSGLAHFELSGEIIAFEDYRARAIFNSDPYESRNKNNKNDSEFTAEYIGPAVFNDLDHHIYFYSQNGFFKGNPDKDLSSIDRWQKVFKPKLLWGSGQRDAVGSPMNVFKIQFTNDNKLVFVSERNGIGIYNDSSLTMLK